MPTRQKGAPAADRAASQNGDQPLRVAPPGRRVVVPQLLGGLVVVFVSILAFLVVYSGAAARDSVLVLANPVVRGQMVAAGDLRVVRLATDESIPSLDPAQLASLVGRLAVTDLPEGTLAAPDLFFEQLPIAAGEAVVGLSLSPGEYPTPRLAIGDTVDVVSIGGDADRLVAPGAVVFDVVELTTQGTRFVSLRLPATNAATVAQAAEGGVRLVLVGGQQ